MSRIRVRSVPAAIEAALRSSGTHPLLARLAAARGIRHQDDLALEIGSLIPPATLLNAEAAAQHLARAIERGERLLIVADYDCDGATACAVGVRALRAFGAKVDYMVPDRFRLGYGLTPELVELAAARRPDWIITVDNGIASVAGVAAAQAHGIRTLITDHHLPARELPRATCIVNPNQPGCPFPSKSLAGVGVMFYVMLALRAEMRRQGAFADRPAPNLGALTDLVALGTVADVVRLDRNNRVLVTHGLKRIRAGQASAGVRSLFAVAGRDPRRAGTFDLGFGVGPRLNAAGRLADMSLGIECLITDDDGRAMEIARSLDQLNRERRTIEGGMLETAIARADAERASGASIALFDPGWHAGVVGIVAARLKDRLHRPAFVFAPADPADAIQPHTELRGSGRSIAALHLRDCLDLVSKLEPDLLLRFGGHAAAAGVTIRAGDFERFQSVFETAAARMLDPAALERVLETDGALEPEYISHPVARLLDAQIWGQGFPPPLFADEVRVDAQRLVADKHLRLKLDVRGRPVEAIAFNVKEALPERLRAVYRLGIDEWNGVESVQLMIEYWEPAR